MSFVVFLDVDGVLNTKTSCEWATSRTRTGVDEQRVKILAGAMRECGASGVVLTSTLKNLSPEHEDYIYLKESLAKFGIEILGKTNDPKPYQRGSGILEYLKDTPEIDEFVILDDNHFDFDEHEKLWESFIDTRERGIENSELASKMPTITAMLFQDAIKACS